MTKLATVRDAEIVVNSLGEFTAAVAGIRHHWAARHTGWDWHDPWFRGQSRAIWALDPSFLRSPHFPQKLGIAAQRYNEQLMLDQFVGSATALMDRPPCSDLEWLVLMQHHGVPTRLLDWTESGLAGLYFALRGSDLPASGDAAVWVMLPRWLFKLQPGAALPRLPSLRNQDWLSPYLPHLGGSGVAAQADLIASTPIPFVPPHISPRVVAQKGRFTLHGFAPGALESLGDNDRAAEGDSAGLQFLRVPKVRRKAIYAELIDAGMTESALFPDLDGIAREVRFKWNDWPR